MNREFSFEGLVIVAIPIVIILLGVFVNKDIFVWSFISIVVFLLGSIFFGFIFPKKSSLSIESDKEVIK